MTVIPVKEIRVAREAVVCPATHADQPLMEQEVEEMEEECPIEVWKHGRRIPGHVWEELRSHQETVFQNIKKQLIEVV